MERDISPLGSFFSVVGIAVTALIDGQGKIIDRWCGFDGEENLRKKLTKLNQTDEAVASAVGAGRRWGLRLKPGWDKPETCRLDQQDSKPLTIFSSSGFPVSSRAILGTLGAVVTLVVAQFLRIADAIGGRQKSTRVTALSWIVRP